MKNSSTIMRKSFQRIEVFMSLQQTGCSKRIEMKLPTPPHLGAPPV
jgi:hypothetical protein